MEITSASTDSRYYGIADTSGGPKLHVAWIHSNKGLMLETSAFKAKFTLSTQLIKPNFLAFKRVNIYVSTGHFVTKNCVIFIVIRVDISLKWLLSFKSAQIK